MTKAIAMISGGLDSVLAVKHMLNLGYDVLPVNMEMPFGIPTGKPSHAKRMCDQMGIALRTENRGEDFFKLIRNPKHGYGKNMNPCIDCRIAMLRRGKQIMEEVGAKFIITGEVVGQRPMSQRKDAMNLVEKEAGVRGFLLRPLCAKNLEPTEVELSGIVDREKLLGFSGRTRKPQMEMAKELGIVDYPAPAGGCELTEPTFGKRLEHLFTIKDQDRSVDWTLLTVGRHIILGPKSKAIISRNQSENEMLEQFREGGDCILEPANFPGPTALIVGPYDNTTVERVGSMMLRYGKLPADPPAKISVRNEQCESFVEITSAATDEAISPFLIS